MIFINEVNDTIRATTILHIAARACMCLCKYVSVCLHEEGLEEHYVREEWTKFSAFKDIIFTRRYYLCNHNCHKVSFLLNYNRIFIYSQAWIHKKSCETDHNRKTFWDYWINISNEGALHRTAYLKNRF